MSVQLSTLHNPQPRNPAMTCDLQPTALPALAALALAWGRDAAWHPRAAGHVLDWLACAAQGAGTSTGQAFAQWLRMQGPGSTPTLAGWQANAAAAAAYHGSLGSQLEMDDVHRSSILHPGPVVVPAALAACTAATTGAQLLAGVVAGVEVMVRVGRTLGPAHYRLWHSTGTAGCFGAAAAAAAVLGLDNGTTAQALALAGTRASGLWQVRHSSNQGKAWHMAGAAREGLAAAQLAACGLTGPLAVLEGESGWLAATAPGADITLLTAAREPVHEPFITDLSFKPWPACRHAHPAMDAFNEALAALPGTTAEASPGEALVASIARIEIHTYPDALRFCDCVHPTDPPQARFSIQHAVAAWALWGAPELAHYEPAALTQPAVAALREKVHLHVAPTLAAAFPARYGARVHIHFHNGQQASAMLADARGDPARPMPAAALHAKAHMLMGAGGWGAARIDAAFAACTGLPAAPGLNALHAVMLGSAAT